MALYCGRISGRQKGEIYSKLGFELLKNEERKYAALCLTCNVILKNTAVKRLTSHKNVCSPNKKKKLSGLRALHVDDEKLLAKSNESYVPCPLITYSNSSIIKTEPLDINLELDCSISGENTKLTSPNKRKRLSGIIESHVDDENIAAHNDDSIATCSLYTYSNNISIKTEPLDNINMDLGYNISEENTKMQNSNKTMRLSGITESYVDDENHVAEADETIATCSFYNFSNNSLIKAGQFDDNQSKQFPKQNKNIMPSYVDDITKQDEENINDALGEFFFGCSIPFSVIESENFKKFIQTLRPTYVDKLPSTKILSTTILDRVHKNCLMAVKKNIGSEATLLIDGWDSTYNKTKTVISILYSSSGERAFLNAWNMVDSSDASEKLVAIIKESQHLALTRFNTTIIAVVSNNVSNTMEIERSTSLWHSTCNLHIANSLAKDIFTSYDDLFKSAGIMTNAFKQSDLEFLVIHKGGHSIKTVNDVQWCSYRDNLVSLVTNLQYMKDIASDQNFGKMVKPEVKFLLFDDQLISDINSAIEIFDPICDLIIKFQNTNKCNLADAVACWIVLKSSQISQHFSEDFLNRKDLAMNFYALSAYLLDPTYDQSNLDHNDKTIAIEFIIRNLTGQGITEFDLYMKKDGFFSLLFQKNIKDASVFWNMAIYKYPEISKLARKLLQIPASSTEIERIFPSWPFVHSSNRDLGFEKSKKLLDVYYSLNICDSSRSDEYQ